MPKRTFIGNAVEECESGGSVPLVALRHAGPIPAEPPDAEAVAA
jgi:hypothetical protein